MAGACQAEIEEHPQPSGKGMFKTGVPPAGGPAGLHCGGPDAREKSLTQLFIEPWHSRFTDTAGGTYLRSKGKYAVKPLSEVKRRMEIVTFNHGVEGSSPSALTTVFQVESMAFDGFGDQF
jgi:hypothetical protein